MTVANPGQPQSSSNQAITALVLGILGLVCSCGPLSVIAWYLGHQERKAIREGRSPAGGESLSLVAVILGILGTALMLWWLFWIFFAGGLVVLQGIFAASQQ
jgi:hypothetical protein